MKKKFGKYIRCQLEELTEKQKEDLEKLITYLEDKKRTDSPQELMKLRLELKLILKPEYGQILNSLLTKEQEIETALKMQQVLLILQDHIDTIEKLQYELGESYQVIEEFLNRPTSLKKHFSEPTYQVLFQKIESLKKEHAKRKRLNQTIQSYDTYLSIFLASRYNLDEMRSLTTICRERLYKKMKSGFLSQYYSEEILESINDKKKEVNKIKKRSCSKLYVLKDETMLSLVKPEIIRVSDYEFSSLNLLKDFFRTFGDIEKILFEEGKIPSYNYAMSVLQDEKLHKILKPEIYQHLVEMLEIETQMKSLKIPERKKLLANVVEAFYRYNGDICVLLENVDVSNLVLLRALEDRLIIGMYGQEVYQAIQNSFQAYQDKKYVLDVLEKAKVKSL